MTHLSQDVIGADELEYEVFLGVMGQIGFVLSQHLDLVLLPIDELTRWHTLLHVGTPELMVVEVVCLGL